MRVVGHVERGVDGPVQQLLWSGANLIGAERGAVRFGGIPFGRCRVGDVGAENDEGGAFLFPVPRHRVPRNRREIVAVAADAYDVPTIGFEPAADIFTETERGVAVDRDVVVVVDQVQLAEPQVPGDRGGLARHPFHEDRRR